MTDIVERLRQRPWRSAAENDYEAKERRQREREEGADEITALRAEVEDLGNRLHHVHRLWANNEHALRAENERLRAALQDIIADSFSVYAIQVARAALEGK